MNTQLLRILRAGNQLKRTPRTGWLMRGIPEAENVAAHSFGVAYSALILAPYAGEPLDLGRLLSLAVLHDLPEGITTDIPAPVWRRLPDDLKPGVEAAALDEIFADSDRKPAIDGLWQELQDNQTAEARFIHEVDKLEMYIQADQYEKQYGNRQLAEFWSQPRRFHFPIIQHLYDQLVEERQNR